MALSVFQNPQGTDWPLGFVKVAAIGTPVNIMVNVDSNNNNAPWTATKGPGNPAISSEYTPRCHKITFQGYQPGANNNGMVPNSDVVYILRSLGPSPGNNNSGGPGNRSDSGAMLYVLQPGGAVTLPADEMDRAPISPYLYVLDANSNGDGALVTLLGCSR